MKLYETLLSGAVFCDSSGCLSQNLSDQNWWFIHSLSLLFPAVFEVIGDDVEQH